MKAVDHRDDLDTVVPYLCETIEQKLYKLSATSHTAITTTDIITATADTLHHFDAVGYVKYIGVYQKTLDAGTLRRALSHKK